MVRLLGIPAAVRFMGVLGLLMAVSAMAGCETDAINRDSRSTFLDADDLTHMTDLMAMRLAGDPTVATLTAGKPIVIVMKPVINDTNEIIVGNEKELYVHRVRVLLAQKQELRSRFTFVLNRAAYDKLLKDEGKSPAELGPVEAAEQGAGRLVPDFALTGRFYAQTSVTSQRRSDFYMCAYQLTRLTGPEAGHVIWEDKYETRKTMKKGTLD